MDDTSNDSKKFLLVARNFFTHNLKRGQDFLTKILTHSKAKCEGVHGRGDVKEEVEIALFGQAYIGDMAY